MNPGKSSSTAHALSTRLSCCQRVREQVIIQKRGTDHELEFWTKLKWTKDSNDRRKPLPEWRGLREETRRNSQDLTQSAIKEGHCAEGKRKEKIRTPRKQVKQADYVKGNPAEF